MKAAKPKIGVIGGGILGTAIAYKLSSKGFKVVLFEKEKSLGEHQSGNNSGVLHCGLNYKPGSLKAKLAVSGIKQMIKFSNEYKIDHDVCGKILVSNNFKEKNILDDLAARGKKNGLKGLKILSPSQVKKIEPNVICNSALLVPEEGIIDYKSVITKMKQILINNGGVVKKNEKIVDGDTKSKKEILFSDKNEYDFDFIFNCTGLFSDRVYEKLTKKKSPIKIIPFRGDYLKFKEEYRDLVRNLVYPTPNPKFPFLGVHFTRTTTNSLLIGPNAALAFKREGYRFLDFDFFDTYDSLSYTGLIKFILKNNNFVLKEIFSSLNKKIFLNQAKKMVPDLHNRMLKKGNSGVRAQAIDRKGNLVMDFKVEKFNNQIHVLNFPSPGATACLAIAETIIKKYL